MTGVPAFAPDPAALAAFDLQPKPLEEATNGLINRTWYARSRAGERVVLQRLNKIFPPEINYDIDVVTTHIAARGLVTPRLRRFGMQAGRSGFECLRREDAWGRGRQFRPHPAIDLGIEDARRAGQEDEEKQPPEQQPGPGVQPRHGLAKAVFHAMAEYMSHAAALIATAGSAIPTHACQAVRAAKDHMMAMA